MNATFAGVHAYDDRLPDLSEAGFAELAAGAAGLLAQLRALPTETLTGAEAMDRELAEGFLKIQRWEATSAHFAWGNPSLFTGEAVWGVLSLLLRPFAPLSERLPVAAARLEAIPRLLDDGRATLHDAPADWCARARRECTGAILLLGDGLDRLLYDENVSQPGLRRAADSAREAFTRFDAFVQAELLPTATHAYACGADVFELLLRRGHFLDYGADELEKSALERIAEEQAALAAGGPRLDPAPQPTPYLYLGRFAALWQTVHDAAEQADVLTIPDWPVRYVEQPAWVREAAPFFYFLPYRSPAPFDTTPVVEYFVPATADESTIKLNHVIHHGSLGHHVQNWHAARAASRIGQLAAVDCAARIAMLCGGTLAEGWACYATDLAEELGLFTPAERFAQHTARLRMAVRAVVDIRLHQARMSLDEAADYYQAQVGMPAGAARAEALKNTLFPGTACMYLAGWDGIWRLRREFAETRQVPLQREFSETRQMPLRREFSETRQMPLRQFHDRLLAFGSVPVALVGRAMRAANGVDLGVGTGATVLAQG